MKNPLIALALTLAACSEERPPQPTSAQADQLNEAEALLNQLDKKERAAPTGTALPDNRN